MTKASLVVRLGGQKLPSHPGTKSGELSQTWGSDLLWSNHQLVFCSNTSLRMEMESHSSPSITHFPEQPGQGTLPAAFSVVLKVSTDFSRSTARWHLLFPPVSLGLKDTQSLPPLWGFWSHDANAGPFSASLWECNPSSFTVKPQCSTSLGQATGEHCAPPLAAEAPLCSQGHSLKNQPHFF